MLLDGARWLTSLLRRLTSRRASPRAPAYLGCVEELSGRHAHGWACDPDNLDLAVTCEAVLDDGEVVGCGVANQFRRSAFPVGVGDGRHAFWLCFERELSAKERRGLAIRITGMRKALPRATNLVEAFEPLFHVAMDVVDNCNLRCPFCLFDHAAVRKTNLMTRETLDAALLLLPFTRDGEFWLSCLHEPTLHPQLVEFVEIIPRADRRKLFFTTNLAKRMPDSFFPWLAGSGMHHVNISVESRDPAVYERLRQGARFPIFAANWERLVSACGQAAKPTPIHYICMAYRSNYRELPDLVAHLLQERLAADIEVRHTYEVAHIPAEFRQAEFLDQAEWEWLITAFRQFDCGRVRLVPPASLQPVQPWYKPGSPPAEPEARLLPGRHMVRLSWDGSMRVVNVLVGNGTITAERVSKEMNVRTLGDPEAFINSLANL